MNIFPTSTQVETSQAEQIKQAEQLLLSTTRQKSLTRPQRSRLTQIQNELVEHLGKLTAVVLIVGFCSGPAIAAERWTPNPERGSAQMTAPGGRR